MRLVRGGAITGMPLCQWLVDRDVCRSRTEAVLDMVNELPIRGRERMKSCYATITVLVLLILSPHASAGVILNLDSPFSFTKLVNEISFYQNADQDFADRGRTLQIVSINSFRFFTDFNFEFTGDFNWRLDKYESHDYYLELSLVKPIFGPLSLNYQQIHGTFMDSTIHQFGVRLSL
jgi:hypothetical protein